MSGYFYEFGYFWMICLYFYGQQLTKKFIYIYYLVIIKLYL